MVNKHQQNIETVVHDFSDMEMIRPTGLAALRFKLRNYLAEFLGTAILVLFGCGSIAQVTVNKAAIGSSYLSINIGWALGLTMAVYVAGPVSGAHLNPAITIASALFRKFPLRQVPGYIISQLLVSIVASVLIYLIYRPAFSLLNGGVRQTTGTEATAGIFATYPYSGSQTLTYLSLKLLLLHSF